MLSKFQPIQLGHFNIYKEQIKTVATAYRTREVDAIRKLSYGDILTEIGFLVAFYYLLVQVMHECQIIITQRYS